MINIPRLLLTIGLLAVIIVLHQKYDEWTTWINLAPGFEHTFDRVVMSFLSI